MREKVLEILNEIRPDVEFEKEKNLVTDQILASFDIVSLVSELSDEFDITIRPKELTKENFDSLESITAMVERLSEE